MNDSVLLDDDLQEVELGDKAHFGWRILAHLIDGFIMRLWSLVIIKLRSVKRFFR